MTTHKHIKCLGQGQMTTAGSAVIYPMPTYTETLITKIIVANVGSLNSNINISYVPTIMTYRYLIYQYPLGVGKILEFDTSLTMTLETFFAWQQIVLTSSAAATLD